MGNSNSTVEEKAEEVKAKITESAIYCGKCGHKIAETKGFKHHLGNGIIRILCKSKSNGHYCRTVNKIEL